MATRAANKRLTREYAQIQASPPPFIVAHPSETNILEWHYILTGPPQTPYEDGQYWGTLIFPPDYPFAPPAIRMHTPSGRFRPSTRLCLSISDFHPRSFNPSWSVSTILIGLQSFMTSDEMTTGSVAGTPAERREAARQSRWWNSTGGGSAGATRPGVNAGSRGALGAVARGDGGAKFRAEWPDLDEVNWKLMKERNVDPVSGQVRPDPAAAGSSCSPEAAALGRVGGSGGAIGAVVGGGQAARDVGQGWLRRNKLLVGGLAIFGYVLLARLLSGEN